jgi:hypothetical protein
LLIPWVDDWHLLEMKRVLPIDSFGGDNRNFVLRLEAIVTYERGADPGLLKTFLAIPVIKSNI